MPPRLSVAVRDPSLEREIAALRAWRDRQADWAEVEWLQRQRLMAAAQLASSPYPPCPYRVDCDADYPRHSHSVAFVPAARPTSPIRNVSFPPHRHGVRAARSASR